MIDIGKRIASLLRDPRGAFERLKDPRRSVPLVLVLALFADIVLTRNDTLGYWG